MAVMNPIALRLHEAALTLDGGALPEIVAMFEIAEREINRLEEARVDVRSGASWQHVAQEMISRCDNLTLKLDQLAALEGEVIELRELRRQVVGLLDTSPNAIRSREGGGPEDIAASLAITVVKLEQSLERADQRWRHPLARALLEHGIVSQTAIDIRPNVQALSKLIDLIMTLAVVKAKEQ